MIKQTITLLTILTFSTLSFAQIQDNRTVDFNEGINTIELDVKTFEITAIQGFVTKVINENEEYNKYNGQVASLRYRIESFANEVDIMDTDSIYENDEYLVVIKLIPKEVGYNAQCFLFKK